MLKNLSFLLQILFYFPTLCIIRIYTKQYYGIFTCYGTNLGLISLEKYTMVLKTNPVNKLFLDRLIKKQQSNYHCDIIINSVC